MKIRDIAFIAIGTALMCVLAPLSIPIGIVPISLATFALYLIGTILGPIKATISVLLYIIIGVLGAPVFSKFGAGPSVIMGPTGGFIIGYVPAVFIQALFTTKFKDRKTAYVFGIIFATIIIYATGLIWFLIVTAGKYTFSQAMAACVYPFLIGDTIKLIISVMVGYKLRPIVERVTDTSRYRSSRKAKSR